VNFLLRCTFFSLFLATAATLPAAPHGVKKPPGEVSLLKLNPHEPDHFRSTSSNGFVLVALQDCSMLIDGGSATLRAGDFRRMDGHTIDLANVSSIPADLVLIRIDRATQPLTIELGELNPRQQLEDASDRNDTLIVALTPVTLRDVRDLSAEDENWKSAPASMIRVQAGQTAWLTPGMHRLRNLGATKARFITIEW
jgi:hypothetical protein